MKRDALWAEMSAVAQQLTDQYCKDDTLEVTALRRMTGLVTISEGLAVFDNWTDVFEPVRRRPILGRRWRDVQAIEQAAEHVEAFLRERPDLAGMERRS